MHQFNLNKINIGKVERFISPVVLVNILVATASALTGLDGYPDREPLLATQLQLFGFYSLLCLLLYRRDHKIAKAVPSGVGFYIALIIWLLNPFYPKFRKKKHNDLVITTNTINAFVKECAAEVPTRRATA